ncbi:MAG: BsaA family SipW-dependent biofilm matrix protein [Longicatena sp.]
MKNTKNKKQNKVSIIALSALLGIGLVAGSLAYFSTSSSFDNIFTVGKPSGGIVETFDNPSKEQVARGGEFKKSAQAINTGETPLLARAKISAVWKKADGSVINDNTLGAGGENAAKLMFGNTAPTATADFSKNLYTSFANDVTEADKANTEKAPWFYSTDGYFYLKTKVEKGTSSAALLKAINVSTNIANATTTYDLKYMNGATETTISKPTAAEAVTQFNTDYGTAHPGTKYTITSKSVATYPDYEGATLTVTIKGDVIQADQKVYDTLKGLPAGTDSTKWNVPDAIVTGWGFK